MMVPCSSESFFSAPPGRSLTSGKPNWRKSPYLGARVGDGHGGGRLMTVASTVSAHSKSIPTEHGTWWIHEDVRAGLDLVHAGNRAADVVGTGAHPETIFTSRARALGSAGASPPASAKWPVPGRARAARAGSGA